jgi:hypothetical protein
MSKQKLDLTWIDKDARATLEPRILLEDQKWLPKVIDHRNDISSMEASCVRAHELPRRRPALAALGLKLRHGCRVAYRSRSVLEFVLQWNRCSVNRPRSCGTWGSTMDARCTRVWLVGNPSPKVAGVFLLSLFLAIGACDTASRDSDAIAECDEYASVFESCFGPSVASEMRASFAAPPKEEAARSNLAGC